MSPPIPPSVCEKPILDREKDAENEKPSIDVEPVGTPGPASSHDTSEVTIETGQSSRLKPMLARWSAKIEGLLGLEVRGIARVLPEEKHDLGGAAGYIQMFALWFGMALSVIGLVVGLLGPLVFELGWIDCVCLTIFANVLAAAGPAYVATFGPCSGLRTMVLGRFFMGYWPQKLTCLLNIIMQTGWGIISCIVMGQLISALGDVSIAVGCVISALCIGVITTFGIRLVHIYERYSAWPQAFAMLILIGASGRDWNTALSSVGDAATVTANRCSFFALVFSATIGFSAISADLYVYYPTDTNRSLIFFSTWSGLWSSVTFVELVGVGIATGVGTNQKWESAYEISSGALLRASYEGLGRFGSFCVVLLAIGCIQNMVPSAYVAALSIQTLGRYVKPVPRWLLCIFLTIVILVCSVAGRNHLYEVFENFLPIMAYWVVSWLTIVIEEHVLFHALAGRDFDWTMWEDSAKLPFGAAAILSWLVGWAGAIIGMAQVWYVGPVAMRVGGYGGDVGNWLAIAFAGVVYPPLRWLEMRTFGR